MNFREFVKKLEKEGKLVKIKDKVSVKYEIASIMKKLDGKPLLFENVKECNIPVVANLYSTIDLFAESLNIDKKDMIKTLAAATSKPKKFKISNKVKYKEVAADLTKLPILTHYGVDGGPYMSSVIVVAKDKEYGINSSYHRMMVIGKNKVAVRILPRHLNEFIKRGCKEVAICVGNSSQVAIASAISADIGVSELEIANALLPTEFNEIDGHVVPESEMIMIAKVLDEQHDEGPFIDLTETYDIVRKQPVFEIKKIYIKTDPMYHALLPGGLEHKTLMGLPREPTIFNEVNKVCKCKNVLITPGGCSWLHAVVQIEKKKSDDGMKAIEAAFNGHKSLKHVVIVDEDINIYDINDVEWAIATRFQASRSLVLKEKQTGSSLDPSSNPDTRETTKVGIDATIPSGHSKEDFKKNKVPGEDKVNVKKYIK
jgi:2,5-furandicarboxylate decarboxylase 1